ncbi:MAG TPA: hypothetical protein VM122_12385 [Usitatibacter sp.]|nr:hypothetical protein [Usitatibacter sp.]
MTASPAGRLAASLTHASVTCELALAMDATLEASERELARVSAILRSAIDGLMAEFGESARREAVVALQFQDLSEQLLASATRRIGMVRAVLGKNVMPPADHGEPIQPDGEAVEFFQEHS